MLRWLFSVIFRRRLLQLDDLEKRLNKIYGEYFKKTEEAKEIVSFSQRRHITSLNIEGVSIDDDKYRDALYDVWVNKAFQLELFVTQQKIVNKMISENTDSAVQLQCMLKGIDLFISGIHNAFKSSERKKNAKNVSVERSKAEISEGNELSLGDQ